MQDNPSLIPQTSASSKTTSNNKKTSHIHHARLPAPKKSKEPNSGCYLFTVPAETLTHITTYVDDPASLFVLSRVNRRLRDHVADDGTWYRVFAFHFWGIGPESYPEDEKKLMFRKSESTWKKEFVKRYNLIRRWEKSRSSTLSYQPHYWSVADMHLLDNVSLMTSTIQYGIVTRSFPLTGRILKGYFGASGTANGRGIGNPNEEFAPNVTCIVMSSCGGTGRIAWGFRNGEVAATSAPRAMDSNRPPARFTRCVVEDEHTGDIRCLIFAGRDDELIVSGCSRGQVKLWDARRTRCLWTGSGCKEGSALPDPCIKLAYCDTVKSLVAAMQNGDVMIWSGFQMQDEGAPGLTQAGLIQTIRVEPPRPEGSVVDALFVDPKSSVSELKILVHYVNEGDFLRLTVNILTGLVITTRFCDGPLGPITCLRPAFVAQAHDLETSPAPLTPVTTNTTSLSITLATNLAISYRSSYILAGDSLGRVCVWQWDADGIAPNINASAVTSCDLPQVKSCRHWQANDDGAVCAIETNDVVIVTGSSRGTLKVWDCLMLLHLRTLGSPASKPSVTGEWDSVGRIILRDDLLVSSVGSRVLVWQPGIATSDKKVKAKYNGKGKGRGAGNTVSKWQQQIELDRDIRESKRLLEDERLHVQRAYLRTRDQQSTLDRLGLSEAEAVEYLQMLSREEEERRHASEDTRVDPSTAISMFATSSADTESDEVFTFDDHFGSDSIHNALPPSRAPSHSAASFPRSIPSSSPHWPPSPPFGPESSRLSTSHSSVSTRSASSIQLSGSWANGSPSGLRASSERSHTSGVATSPNEGVTLPQSDGEDEELRFILDLSLAEARSRGEI